MRVGMQIWEPNMRVGGEGRDPNSNTCLVLYLSAVLTCGLGLLRPVASAQLLVEVEAFRTGKVESLSLSAAVEHSTIVWVAEESLTRTTEIGASLHLLRLTIQRMNEGRW